MTEIQRKVRKMQRWYELNYNELNLDLKKKCSYI